ncbi:hypothetical protein [Paenibacillus sinopodophylli]|uniref:hypothetical protein n=1 Tax=Paenibacillus sinopodophylli TaxID=1837342 RepID=UPI00110CFB3D|nr:hypothetical protein [Paenibacillus sinopodophylli]
MKRMSFYLFVFLFIIAGCSNENAGNTLVEMEQAGTETVKHTIKMPKEMPSTFKFMVRFGYGTVNKNEINTFQGTITKDLIANGTATMPMKFTKEELRIIYNKMKEINIMDEKELEPAKQSCQRSPYNEDIWEININGETKTLIWTDKYCAGTTDTQQLLELRQFVQQMVEGKEEYKKMPESEGGYE